MTTQHDGGPAPAHDPPRRSRIALMTPLVVAALTLGLIGWSAWPTLRPVRSVTVTQAVYERSGAAPPTPANINAPVSDRPTVQAPGWLEAEPFITACTALADGVVESVEVLEGDRVEKGQVVARLVSEDSALRLARAEAAMASAASALRLAEAERRAAQTDWDEPIERRRAVETGLAGLAESRAELDQLPHLVDSQRAVLVRLEEELTRAERSHTGGAATEIEVIRARQRVEAQAATVRSLEARGPVLEARIQRLAAELRAAERNLDLRVEERRRLDAAEAEVERVTAALAQSRVARDQAALELDRMTIRAPISGYVQRRLKTPGDKVVRMMDSPHSAHLLHLYDPSRLQVRVDVPLADAAHVAVGQACEVIVEVLPDQTFEGVVLRTTHEADLQKNTLQVKVGVIDPSPQLRPEMLTRVKFLGRDAAKSPGPGSSTRTPLGRVLVPNSAIDDRRVWAVRDRRGERGVVRPIEVDRLEEREGWASIAGAVRPGELLVVDASGLRDGELVRIAPTPRGDAR